MEPSLTVGLVPHLRQIICTFPVNSDSFAELVYATKVAHRARTQARRALFFYDANRFEWNHRHRFAPD